MRNLLSVSIFALVFMAFTAFNPNIEGTWIAEIQGPNGPAEITYNFNVDGDTLTGTVVGGMGTVEILNGEVSGDEFSFDTQFNNGTISHQCELQNDSTISMKFSFEGGGPEEPQDLTLRRSSGE